MKFTAYAVVEHPLEMVPASVDRAWMDATPERFAYRCLPLAIANGFGWELRCPFAFAATWNGGERREDIRLRALEDGTVLSTVVESHFGSGVLTFHTGYLFRTAPAWDTFVTAPVNRPKDGIQALSGIVETDWLPFPFTMNWKFTRPGRIEFARGEPVCTVFPVRRNELPEVEPEIRGFHDAPEALKRDYAAWRESRIDFQKRIDALEPEAVKQGWQRHYFKGEKPTDGTPVDEHRTRLRLMTPVDLRARATPGVDGSGES